MGMTKTAVSLYSNGYTLAEIEGKTGCTGRELLLSGAITPDMKEQHKKMVKFRSRFISVAAEWDTVRNNLLSSGNDLGKIQIVSMSEKR